jgi:hypothetical protein
LIALLVCGFWDILKFNEIDTNAVKSFKLFAASVAIEVNVDGKKKNSKSARHALVAHITAWPKSLSKLRQNFHCGMEDGQPHALSD